MKVNNTVYTTYIAKAEILNEHYQSVFWDEDNIMNSLSEATSKLNGPSSTVLIMEIIIDEDMVHNELSKLDTPKAPGPNGLRASCSGNC